MKLAANTLPLLKLYFQKTVLYIKALVQKTQLTIQKIASWLEQEKLNAQDEPFVADSKVAMLSKTTPFANAILYITAIFLIIALIWSYFAVINQQTVADGKVIPSTQIKIVQSLDGGILEALYVKEGDFVKKNQILAILDNTRYKSDYQQSYQKYLALLAMTTRLAAETDSKENIIFPAELQSHADLMQRENQEFIARKQALVAELTNLQHNYELANEQLAIQAPMVEKGIVPKIDYLRTQRDANEVKSRLLDKQDKFHEDAWNELNQRKTELAVVKESLASLSDKMNHTILHSPVEGIVKKIHIMTISGVVSPGMAIMDIVPMDDTLLVQAKVRPADIAFIHPGENATVKITAYDYSIYGNLKGKVEYISADTIDDENKNNKRSGADQNTPAYYLVNIRTTQNYLGSNKYKLPIIPGMIATVHIQTGEKTVLQYFLKPLIKAKEEALREK